MDDIYEEVIQRNHIIISQPDFQFVVDPYLENSCDNDFENNRNCVALYGKIYGDFSILQSFIKEMKIICGESIVPYDNIQAILHFTMFQFVGFDTQKVKRYLKEHVNSHLYLALQQLVPQSFGIQYKGVIVTPKAIILKGYPHQDVNAIRSIIRTTLIHDEPYTNYACHSTIARFKKELTRSQIQKLLDLCREYENVNFGWFWVPEFQLGIGTWKLNNHECVSLKIFSTIKLIAHRGNMEGPRINKENTMKYLADAMTQGFDVETDVWYISHKWYLGHDHPDHETTLAFLKNPKIWCHAKSHATLVELIKYSDIHVFSHDVDDCVITSKGFLWSYPGKPIYKSICVMPERAPYSWYDICHCIGICSDFVGEIRQGNFQKIIAHTSLP